MTHTQENTVPEGFMKNALGHLVPLAQVREHDKLRDDVAQTLVLEAIAINERLEAFKKKALADIDDLVTVSSDRYDVKLGGKKGNVSITTFDGQYKIERAYADRISFTEEILAAKELVNVCIRSWSEGANSHLLVLVERAFKANKQGQLKAADLLNLLRIEIDDPSWKAAMQALKDSILVIGTAVYVRVYRRADETDKYLPISLNIAGV